MNIHNLSKEDVLKSLVTSEHGLSDEESAKRLREYGLNEIKEVSGKPLYRKLIAQFTHFLAVLLWLAACLCFVSEYLHPGEGLLQLGIAIIAVVIINALFTFIQEYRTEKAVEELKKLLPFHVKVLRNGLSGEIVSGMLVPGDIVMLNEGDKVPADARLIESSRLMVNNAPLTGESDPKHRDHVPYAGEYPDSSNIVFAGTLVVSGHGKAVVFSTGMSTEFGKIAHLTGGVQEKLSPLQKEIVRVTKIVAVIAVTMGLSFFLLGVLTGKSFWHNFLFAIGIIIANVPEGLLPTVTLSLAMGSQRMAGKKALIKTLSAVETLGSVTVICTDKTGTLTQNRMEVERIWTASESDALRIPSHLTGEGKGGGEAWSGIAPTPSSPPVKGGETSINMLMKTAYFCNNATCENGVYKGDPTETAILKKAKEFVGELRAERVFEIPFDSGRKRMTTVCKLEVGREKVEEDANKSSTFTSHFSLSTSYLAFTKGAMETVLPLCSRILTDGTTRVISDDDKSRIMQVYHSMMDEGLRVIAFAYKEYSSNGSNRLNGSLIESNLIFAGLMGLEDPPRPEVTHAIAKCRDAGIRVIMITGDAGRTAVSIAGQIGLYNGSPVVVEGNDLISMPDNVLRKILGSEEILFARMTPDHKMRIVSILKDEGERVAVTGDGVNDAPALKKADIGIAMGIAGTDVAREAADMVLLDDNFASIVNAVEEGRSIFENIQKFISYIFASNIPEIVPYLAYVLFSIPLPLTIMQILAVDLGTDIFPALALGAERPSKDLMKQPPRKADERLLNFMVLGRAYLFLGPIEAAAGLIGFFYVLNTGGWEWGTSLLPDNAIYLQATSACLAGIIVCQVGNVFACRSFRQSVFSLGIFSNRLILSGIFLELSLSAFIFYHPLGNSIFGTAPLGWKVIIMLIPFGIGLLLAEELRKFLVRRSEG